MDRAADVSSSARFDPEPRSVQEALVAAAARIIATEGPERLSIRRLAAAVGTSTMAVYTWYGGKANLVRAVFREAFDGFRVELLATPTTSDALGDLVGLGWAYRHYALANPSLYTVMFGRDETLFEPGPDDLALAVSTFDLLVAAVSDCIEAGILAGDVGSSAWQLWAAVHGAVSLELIGHVPGSQETGEEAYRRLLATMLIGLGADRDAVAGLDLGPPH